MRDKVFVKVTEIDRFGVAPVATLPSPSNKADSSDSFITAKIMERDVRGSNPYASYFAAWTFVYG